MSRPRWPLRALIVLLSFLSLSQGVPLDTPRPGEDAEYPSKPDGHPFALQPRDTGNRIPRDYDIAVMKGKELRCAMTLDARLAQTCFKDQSKPITSRFDQYSQLEQYGWTHGYNILDRMGNMQGSLDWLFRELHVLGDPPGSDGHTVYVDLAHVKQYTQGNQKLKPSEGYYANIYNVVDGVLIADALQSPASTVNTQRESECPNPDVPIPDLNKWSDLTFLEYEELCKNEPGASVKNLKYIVQSLVDNDDTLRILRHLLGRDSESIRIDNLPKDDEDTKANEETKFWDEYLCLRETYRWNTDEFTALIATPNGRISAWLLIQHKEKLGNKRIAEIEVFVQHVDDKINPGLTRPGMLLKIESE